jgi:class 3 adenylate cyclase/HAMP domain-containing protein
MPTRARRTKFSLASKITLLVLSVVIIIMGTVSYFTIYQEERLKLAEMDKRMTDVGNMIAALKLIEPLAGETVAWPIFREFIKVVRNLDPNILYITIVGNDNEIKAFTLNPTTAATLDTSLEGIDESAESLKQLTDYKFPPANVARISGDIVVEDKPIAVVKLRFSLLNLNREVMFSKIRTIVLTLIMMALGFFGAVWVARNVTKPIGVLTQAMEKVALGDLSVNAPILSRDEIGQLTESFNLMVQDLKEKVRIKGAFDAVADELKEVEKIKEAFQQYILKEVQERFVDSAGMVLEEREGDRHSVVILFADLSQVAKQASTQNASQLAGALEEYFRKFVSTLFEYEGQVYKFIENTFMVVFGIPLAHSDDDRRAILSAVSIQKKLAEINRIRVQRQEAPLFISLGVAMGEAVGNLMSAEGMSAANVIRDYLSFTQKMSAQPYSVVMVAGDIFKRVNNLIRAEKVEDLQMPDSGQTLEVYRITGAKF